MLVLRVIKTIIDHPLNRKNKAGAIYRFIKWQLLSRLSKKGIKYKFTENSVLIVQKGMTGATGNIYCGLHDFPEMGFLLHFLREDDLFADIGANVGSYTVLGSAHTGAATIVIEPSPQTFVHLQRNITANNISGRVTALNIAAGSRTGTAEFTSGLDTVNHIAAANEINTLRVPVETLDDIFNARKKYPALLKVDVEGFETEVISGASATLENQVLKAIIIELNGLGNRYGFSDRKIHNRLTELGFQPFIYNPFTRTLSIKNDFGSKNTIYLRDIPYINNRLQKAGQVRILNQLF